MERVIITIDTGNAAFGGCDNAKAIEVASILRELARRIDDHGTNAFALKLRDVNGNTCGSVEVE